MNYTAVASDHGQLISTNGVDGLTLPTVPPFSGWQICVKNRNASGLRIDRNGTAPILILEPNESVYIASDGNDYFIQRGVAAVETKDSKPLQEDGKRRILLED